MGVFHTRIYRGAGEVRIEKPLARQKNYGGLQVSTLQTLCEPDPTFSSTRLLLLVIDGEARYGNFWDNVFISNQQYLSGVLELAGTQLTRFSILQSSPTENLVEFSRSIIAAEPGYFIILNKGMQVIEFWGNGIDLIESISSQLNIGPDQKIVINFSLDRKILVLTSAQGFHFFQP